MTKGRPSVSICIMYVVSARISSAKVDIWRRYWVKLITTGTRALCSRCSTLRSALACHLHWTQGARQAAVACDWLQSGPVISAGTKGKSRDLTVQ